MDSEFASTFQASAEAKRSGDTSGGFTLGDLAGMARWVTWRTEISGRGIPTKVPYAYEGTLASTTDPKTWCVYDDAVETAERLVSPHGPKGIGIILGELGNGTGLGGIDLDASRTPDAPPAPWAEEIIARFPTYREVSPSGTGEKLFFLYNWGDIGTLRNRQLLGPDAFGRQFKVPGGQGHAPGIEIYLAARFFTVTWHQASSDDTLRRASCADLEWVIATAGPALKGKPSAKGNGHDHSGAHDGARDESRSAVAFRLARQLARTGATREEIDTAFRTAADWLTDKGLRNGEREWTRTLDRAVPPSASTERQGDTDAADPSEGLYDPWNAPASEAEQPLDLGIWDAGLDDYKIPPRGWLLGTSFCRGFLSSLIADGGVGKTAVRIAQAMSLATGRKLTGEHVHRRSKVLVVSLEDSKDELRRRILAAMKYHQVTPAELKGWLFCAAPRGIKLAELQDGSPQRGKMVAWIEQAIDTYHPDLIIFDPFIKSHGIDENNNNGIDFVCTLLATMCIEREIAIDIPHHTSKGLDQPGNANRGRGASAMKDAARLVYTLTVASDDEAKIFGIGDAQRKLLIRMDSGKVNIAPPSREATWFELTSVPLDNPSKEYPGGDNVQTVVPWTPPGLWDGLDSPLLNRILDDINKGLDDGQRYSAAASVGEKRAAWGVVKRHVPALSEPQAREIIKTWVKSGTLYSEQYDDPVERKPRLGLQVNHTLRPS